MVNKPSAPPLQIHSPPSAPTLQTPSPPHHSASDWSFSDARWQIVTSQYHSFPSSIRYKGEAVGLFSHQVCKHVDCFKIPEGSISTWHRQTDDINRPLLFHFRNTALLPLANDLNCYLVRYQLNLDEWFLWEQVDGVRERLWRADKSTGALDTWYHHRVTWWLSWDIMVVRFDLEVGGAWVQQGDVITVSDPLYGSAVYQRPGLGAFVHAATNEAWFDDTAISAPP